MSELCVIPSNVNVHCLHCLHCFVCIVCIACICQLSDHFRKALAALFESRDGVDQKQKCIGCVYLCLSVSMTVMAHGSKAGNMVEEISSRPDEIFTILVGVFFHFRLCQN